MTRKSLETINRVGQEQKRVCRHQRGNQILHIEGQTTQWQKKKTEWTNSDLQKTTHKTKDRETRKPLRRGVNSGAPEG
jgi:hypothetical protein